MHSRSVSALTAKLERSLFAYATVATAAGIGILALQNEAEAKVIYTPADVVIGNGGVQSYLLDVNHDGIGDFTISQFEFNFVCSTGGQRAHFRFLQEEAGPGNSVVATNSEAMALYEGVVVDSTRPFRASTEVMAFSFKGRTCEDAGGNWLDVKRRYLGLKFQIDGKTHYGWARLNARHIENAGFRARLTGYAYQTVPDRRVITGKHSHAEPATLGHLALGAAGR